MAVAPYELVHLPREVVARVRARGRSVLSSPTINRGTAFTLAQREQLELTGLLPTGVSTLEGQVRRVRGRRSESISRRPPSASATPPATRS